MANVIHSFTAICAIALSRLTYMEYIPIFLPRGGILPQTTDNNLGKATRHWFLFILCIANTTLALCEGLFVMIYSFPVHFGIPVQTFFGSNNIYIYLRWFPSTFYLCLYVMISVFLFELSFASTSVDFNLSYIYHWQLFSALLFILFFLITSMSELQFMIYWILSFEYASLFLFITFCGRNIISKLPKTASSSSASSSSRLNGSNILNSSVSTQIQNRIYPFLIVAGTSLVINSVYCFVLAIQYSETDMLAVSSHFWLTIIDCSVLFITQIALSFEILYILTKRQDEYSSSHMSGSSGGSSSTLKSWFSRLIRPLWSRNNNNSSSGVSYRSIPTEHQHPPTTSAQQQNALKNGYSRSNNNSSTNLHKSIVMNGVGSKLQYNTATNATNNIASAAVAATQVISTDRNNNLVL